MEIWSFFVGEDCYGFSRHPANIAFKDVTDSDPTIGISLSQHLCKFLAGANPSPIHVCYHVSYMQPRELSRTVFRYLNDFYALHAALLPIGSGQAKDTTGV